MFRSIKVWYNPVEIANVISLKMVKSMFRVTYDNDNRNGIFIVHTDKVTMEFFPHPKGLHYLDFGQCKGSKMLTTITVQGNYEEHTKYEIEKANEAMKLQGIMGHPSQRDFEGMVCHNMIKNCSVTLKKCF